MALISNFNFNNNTLLDIRYDTNVSAGGSSNIPSIYDYLNGKSFSYTSLYQKVTFDVYLGSEKICTASNYAIEGYATKTQYFYSSMTNISQSTAFRTPYSSTEKQLQLTIVFKNYFNTSETETYTIGTVSFIAPILTGISVNPDTDNLQTTFYVNDTFNCTAEYTYEEEDEYHETYEVTETKDAFTVVATYRKQVANTTFVQVVDNYTITAPDMTSKGNKNVTISYGGYSTAYQIIVHGVETSEFSALSRTHYKLGIDAVTGSFPITCTITYSDGTTETQTLTSDRILIMPNMSTAGTKYISVATYSQKTNELVGNIYTIYVSDLTGLLISVDPTKKVYNGGETLDPTGITVLATYPDGYGNDDVTSKGVTYSSLSNAVGKQTITATYQNKTASFDVYMSGIVEPVLDYSNISISYVSLSNETYAGHLTVLNNNLSTILDNIRVLYKTRTYTSSGTYTDSSQTIAANNELTINKNITLAKGDNTINVELIKSSITISKDFKISAYYYDELHVENFETTLYGTGHKVALKPNTEVYGIDTSNQDKHVLSSSEYTITPAVGTDLAIGTTNVVFASNEVPSITSTQSVNVHDDVPDSDAILTVVSGTLNKSINNTKYYYSSGETVDFSSIVLQVSKMMSGNPLTLSSNEYTARLYRTSSGTEINKDSFTFNDNDTTGDYTLELSFGNLTPITYNIVLDYVTSVSVDTSLTQTTYRCGEPLHLDQIKGTKTLASGGDPIPLVASDIADITHTFDKVDKTNNNSETETLTLTICGFEEEIEFTIICIKSISMSLIKSAYNIHEALQISSITVTYSDNSPRTLREEEYIGSKSKIVWKDGQNDFDITNMTFANIRSTNAFTLDGTYTEEGFSLAINNQITILALKEIELVDRSNQKYSKVIVNHNDLVGSISEVYLVKAKFNDNSYATSTTFTDVYNSDFTQYLSESRVKSRITNCKIRYNWVLDLDNDPIDTLDCTFDIWCNKLIDLSLNWGSISSTHYVEDEIPFNTITSVVATFSSLEAGEDPEDEEYSDYVTTTSSDPSDPDYLDYTDLDYSFSNNVVVPKVPSIYYKFSTSGSYRLYASYTVGGLTASAYKDITVYDVTLTGLTVTFTGAYSLIEEQTLTINSTNTTIVANFNNGNVALDLDDVLFYEKTLNDEYVAFNVNKQLTLEDSGKVIYVAYKNYADIYATFATLSVSAKTLSSIAITKNPTKTTYTIGDTFSLRGIEVTATFDNGTTDKIYYEDLTASGIVTNRALTESDIEREETVSITVTYIYGTTTKTATYNISLVFPDLADVRVDTSFATTIFKNGDTFSSTGLLVYAVYTNGYEEQVESTSYTINTSAFVSNSIITLPTNQLSGKTEYGLRIIPITVTNPHKVSDIFTNTTDYKITVTSNSAIEVTWLEVDNTVSWDSYFVGDVFDAKGVKFMVKDGNGEEYQVDFTTNPPKGSILRRSQKLTITCYYANTNPQTYQITINVAHSNQTIQSANYKIAIGDKNNNLFTSMQYGETTILLGTNESGETIYPIFRDVDVTVDTNGAHDKTYGYNILNDVISNMASKCIGYMDMGMQDDYGNIIKNAHVVLFDDPINPIDGDGNITVKFPHYVSGYADRINNSTFGIIFNKHLFVSGNPNYKNCDWHTENINVAQTENYNQIAESDYSYFSDLDYCYYGTDDTAIVGYDIYRDGDLVVLKESSRTQATLYRREAKIITAVDSQGNVLTGHYEDAYPSYDINFNGGDGAISNRSIINFMGDTLFLTKNGLKVLSSKDTTYNKEKIVYDVSTYINPKILNEDLENAHLFTYKEKLLLKTSRGVYVGEYTLRNDNKEYEWYFLDNINADLFFEYDDELYFMNNTGAIYKFSFNESLYKDSKRTFIGVGGTLLTNISNSTSDGISVNDANDRIIVSSDYADKVKTGVEFHLITNQDSLIHASIGNFIEKAYRENQMRTTSYNHLAYIGVFDKDTNIVEIKPYTQEGEVDTIKQIEENDKLVLNRDVYIDSFGLPVAVTNQPILDKKYKLVKVDADDPFNYQYRLVDENNNVCNLSTITQMRLSFVINDLATVTITNIEDYTSGGKTFQLLGDHNRILDLIHYGNRDEVYSAVITDKDIVKAYFITKPYDMGTVLYEKTVWQWSIVNDTALSSNVDVGYLTSSKQGGFVKPSSGSTEYSLKNFSFESIQFTTDNLPHIYTRYRVLSGIGFISFVFKNYGESNIVLDKLSLTYTISQSIKGVK